MLRTPRMERPVTLALSASVPSATDRRVTAVPRGSVSVRRCQNQEEQGDKGGNDAFIRIRTSPVKLHAFWDGLLGNSTTGGAINSDVREIEAAMKEKAADIQKEIDAHQTVE